MKHVDFGKISDSFKNFIFQCAMDIYEKEYFPYEILFDASTESLNGSYIGQNKIKPFEYALKISDEHELQESWFSDKYYFGFCCLYCPGLFPYCWDSRSLTEQE